MLRELQACWWLTVRLHRDYPRDGWRDAWRTARMLRRIRNEVYAPRELTEAEQFELEVEMDLAWLPVAEWVVD